MWFSDALVDPTPPSTATACVSVSAFTWHDDEGALWLHGDQAGAEDAGSVGGGDAAHLARLLQPLAERLEVPPAQQDAPVCDATSNTIHDIK